MVAYHSPSASDAKFFRRIENVSEALTIKGDCLIIGDFNIDVTVDRFYKKKLLTGMLSSGMKK